MRLTLDGLDVLLAILELLADMGLVGVENVGAWLAVCLWERRRPASVANTSCEVAREGVCLGGLEVHIMSTGGTVVVKERVLIKSVKCRIANERLTYHVLDFTGICVHATSSFTRLDVSPDHRDHVSLIVHLVWLGHYIKIGSEIDLQNQCQSRECHKGRHF
jgi:hypothetical protein